MPFYFKYKWRATLTFTGLVPNTMMNMYCVTRSSTGVITTSYNQLYRNVRNATTLCCRQVYASLTTSRMRSDQTMYGALEVTWDALPSSAITMALTALFTPAGSSAARTVRPFLPPSLIISPDTKGSKLVASLSQLDAGTYTLTLTAAGTGSDVYNVVYGLSSFVVIDANINYQPPTPQLVSSIFSNDGESIVMLFSSKTDRGAGAGVGRSFKCNILFAFAGSAQSSCVWRDESSVLARISSLSNVVPGNNVSLVGGLVRAACESVKDQTQCKTWNTTKTTVVQILPPAAPITPSAVLSAPTVISVCDRFVLDLSQSKGSGGRPWQAVEVSISGGGTDATDGQARNISKLQTFFASTYRYDPPSAVPPGLFEVQVGAKPYVLTVRVCNFLGTCSPTSTMSVSVTSLVAPVVAIVGKKTRTMFRSESLTLYSNAYVSTCGQQQSTRGLRYTWQVIQDGDVLPKITSTSVQPGVFQLHPNVLTAKSAYTVSLSVSHSISGLSSSTFVNIFVAQSALVPIISGGSTRTLRIGDTTSLDARGSFDPDDGVTHGLAFEWACTMTRPVRPGACGVVIGTDTAMGVAVLTAADPTLVNSTSIITVTVSDPVTTRSAQASVQVTLTAPGSPVVAVASAVTKIASHQKLRLFGVVQLFASSTLSWAVDDPSLDLAKISMSRVSMQAAAGKHTFNLLLSANTLPKATDLTFTLAAGGVESSISVKVVGSPIPGLFKASPATGRELSDVFYFSASSWKDDELPLSYSFGFLTAGNDVMGVQSRSELPYASSQLPRGLSTKNNEIDLRLTVFNSLDSMTIAWATVTVSPVKLTAAAFEVMVSEQLSHTTAESITEMTKNFLANAAAVINAVNCSLSPNCISLGREECSLTAHTCGPCLEGLLGDSGADNSLCLSPDEVGDSGREDADTTSFVACASDSDCQSVQVCDQGRCQMPQKECPQDCWGRGVCRKELIALGEAVDSCTVGESSCRALCVCNEGFGGVSCGESEEDVAAKQRARLAMVTALADVLESDDITEDSLETLVTLVTQLGPNLDEISVDICASLIGMASVVLETANELHVPYETVQNILSITDVCGTLYAHVDLVQKGVAGGDRRVLREVQMTTASGEPVDVATASTTLSVVLDSFSAMVSEDMALGQPNVNFIQSLYRTVNGIFSTSDETDVVVNVPQTALEIANGKANSAVTYVPGYATSDSVAISLVESLSRLRRIGTDSNMVSNSIRVRVQRGGGEDVSGSLRFVLQNHMMQEYYEVPHHNVTFHTMCTPSMANQTINHTCPSGFVVYHPCNGSSIMWSTDCPRKFFEPTCTLITTDAPATNPAVDDASSRPSCTTVAFTVTNTTCECVFGASAGRRHLGKRCGVL